MLGHLVRRAAEPKGLESTGTPSADDHQVGGRLVGELEQCRCRRPDQFVRLGCAGPADGLRVVPMIDSARHDDLCACRSCERRSPGPGCRRAGRTVISDQHSRHRHSGQSPLPERAGRRCSSRAAWLPGLVEDSLGMRRRVTAAADRRVGCRGRLPPPGHAGGELC